MNFDYGMSCLDTRVGGSEPAGGWAGKWRVIADGVRLQELKVDEKGDGTVEMKKGGEFLTHHVSGVVRLFRLTVAGEHQGLRLDRENGGRAESVFVWFRVPASPEELDGLAESELQE